MITDIIEIVLTIQIILLSLAVMLVIESSFLKLVSLLIEVLCFGFIGIMEAIKEGK